MTTHNAPPVVYPLGRSRLQGVLLLGLWFTALSLPLLWFYVTRQFDWRIFLAIAAVMGAGAVAYMGWRNSPVGQLAWDGQLWRWESPSYQVGVVEQKLAVIFDFQHLLLLRIENPAQASLWLWVERKAFPDRWLDLRRAVYSPHKEARQPQPQDLRPAQPRLAVIPGPLADTRRVKP